VDLHRQVLAAAERPADAGEVDTHLLGLQPEARAQPGRGRRAATASRRRRRCPPSPSGTQRPDSGPRNGLSWMPDLVHARDGHVASAPDRRGGITSERTTFGRGSSR
jgi:hypothetical protein